MRHILDATASCSCGAHYMGGHPAREETELEVAAYQELVWNAWVMPWFDAHVLDVEGGQGALFPVAGDNSVR